MKFFLMIFFIAMFLLPPCALALPYTVYSVDGQIADVNATDHIPIAGQMWIDNTPRTLDGVAVGSDYLDNNPDQVLKFSILYFNFQHNGQTYMSGLGDITIRWFRGNSWSIQGHGDTIGDFYLESYVEWDVRFYDETDTYLSHEESDYDTLPNKLILTNLIPPNCFDESWADETGDTNWEMFGNEFILTATPVPEPGTVVLFAIGIMAVSGRRKFSKNKLWA